MSQGTNTSAGVTIPRGQFSANILKSKAHEFGSRLELALDKKEKVFIMSNFYSTNYNVQNRTLFQGFQEEIVFLMQS